MGPECFARRNGVIRRTQEESQCPSSLPRAQNLRSRRAAGRDNPSRTCALGGSCALSTPQYLLLFFSHATHAAGPSNCPGRLRQSRLEHDKCEDGDISCLRNGLEYFEVHNIPQIVPDPQGVPWAQPARHAGGRFHMERGQTPVRLRPSSASRSWYPEC